MNFTRFHQSQTRNLGQRNFRTSVYLPRMPIPNLHNIHCWHQRVGVCRYPPFRPLCCPGYFPCKGVLEWIEVEITVKSIRQYTNIWIVIKTKTQHNSCIMILSKIIPLLIYGGGNLVIRNSKISIDSLYNSIGDILLGSPGDLWIWLRKFRERSSMHSIISIVYLHNSDRPVSVVSPRHVCYARLHTLLHSRTEILQKYLICMPRLLLP